MSKWYKGPFFLLKEKWWMARGDKEDFSVSRIKKYKWKICLWDYQSSQLSVMQGAYLDFILGETGSVSQRTGQGDTLPVVSKDWKGPNWPSVENWWIAYIQTYFKYIVTLLKGYIQKVTVIFDTCYDEVTYTFYFMYFNV